MQVWLFLKKEFPSLYGRGQYTRDPVPQTATSNAYFLGVVSEESKCIFSRLPCCYAAGMCFGYACHQAWRDLVWWLYGIGVVCNSFYQELLYNEGVRQEDVFFCWLFGVFCLFFLELWNMKSICTRETWRREMPLERFIFAYKEKKVTRGSDGLTRKTAWSLLLEGR